MSLTYPHRRKRIEDVPCPAVKGLPDDIIPSTSPLLRSDPPDA